MKPSILFVDMNEALLPLVKSVADRGCMPILMGPIAAHAKSKGIPCFVFEDYSPVDVQIRSLEEAQRIAEELPHVMKDPAVREAFGSSVGSFLPYTGKGFFEKLMKIIVNEATAALTFERLVQNCNLALIVFRTENDPVQRTLIRLARKHHVGTLQIAHAIFTKTLAKVAGEYDRALRSDYISVFGERARRFLEDIGCERERIFVSGSPYWDQLYLPHVQLNALEARKRLHLDSDKPVILFGTSYPLASSAFYPSWVKQLAHSHLSMIHAIREMNTPVQIILRPHPWELGRVGFSVSQERELLERYKSWLTKQGLANVLISRDRKVEAIRAADVVLTGAMTSLIVEAMILNRPVVVCPLEINFAYQPYTTKDGIVVVEDQTQLPQILKNLLIDPSQKHEIVQQQQKAVEDINYGNDGKAIERLQELILQLANKSLSNISSSNISSSVSGPSSEDHPKSHHDDQYSSQTQGENDMSNVQNPSGVSIHQPGKLSKGAVLDVGLKCTHSCGFCYYSYLDKSDDQFKGMRRAKFRTLEECKKILQLLKNNGFINFDYTGGEATLHPDIIEITRYAHQELGLKGRMITLGQFLMQQMKNCQHETLIEGLLDAGLTNFLLSVHAVDRELFHKITGESFDKLHRAMRYLDDKGFHYSTNTVVFEWNYQHLPQIARQLITHGVYLHNFIIMNAYYEWNKDGRAFGVQAKYSDIYPYLQEAVDILESHNVGVNIRYAPLCAVKGMEKNLVGMVGVRYDPYEWMNAAGHFGGTPEQCAAVYPLTDGEIESYLAYRPLDGQLETGTKITGARGDVKYFTEACEGCQARNVCDGIDGNYLKLYGSDEFTGYAQREEAPLQKARYSYTIPFMVKVSQYADMKSQVAQEFQRMRSKTSTPLLADSRVELIQIDKLKEREDRVTLLNDHDPAESPRTSGATTAGRSVRNPRVSVVVVSYNYGRYLAEAVQSVLVQTFRDFEVIIVNDGSSDNTAEVAERLKKSNSDHRITVINQANAGQPAISRNNGIEQSKGDYILCLDADDKIAPTMLERCVEILDRDSSLSIVYTDRLDFDGVDQVVQAGEYNFSRLRYANHISYCALFRRRIWGDIGGYRTNVKGCEDWDFWVAAGARGYTGHRIPQALFHYRRHDTGVFQEALANLQERAAQIVLNNQEAYTPSNIETAKVFLASRPQEQNAQDTSPLVSVIIPTYNRPDRLVEAIRSVLSQTYQNIEVLVINDGGKEIETMVTPLDQAGRIKYIRLSKNQERSHARNMGLRVAEGKYIAYLDDDDRYYAHHIEALVTFLETTDGKVAYSDAYRIHEEKRGDAYVTTNRDIPYSRDFDPDLILVGNHIPMLCLMHAKSCLDVVGGFDESLVTHEDWDLIIRLSRHYSVQHLQEVTAEYSWRMDGTSTTSKIPLDFLLTKKTIYKKNEDLFRLKPHLLQVRDRELADLEKKVQSKGFDCSIIIPVYNKAELTEQCLTRLAQVTHGISYEVVIVDNASTDVTPTFLSTLGGDVQIIRNHENLGFAKACNQGAQVAKGRYLVFLNNDTIPLPGWLEPLLDEVRTHPQVEVVGSKLLYPDGTVQHAGVVFSRKGGLPYHWGMGMTKDSPLVGQRRMFKAVTAACMLVGREAFDRAGGFDEGYINGFEDVDLCLKIWKNGGEVVYQPNSCLYHLESQTPGRLDHMPHNGARLVSRWGDVWLEDDDIVAHENGCAIVQQSVGPKKEFRLIPLQSEQQKTQWGYVVKVEEMLNGRAKGMMSDDSLREELQTCLSQVSQWPNDSGVLEWGAEVSQTLGFQQLACRFWERLLKITEHPESRLGLARVAFDQGQFQEAQNHLHALGAGLSQHSEGLILQGRLLVQRQQAKEAESFFKKALSLDSQNKMGRLGLGIAILEQERLQEANDIFLSLHDEYPDDEEVIQLLLRAGNVLQDWERLTKRLEKFLLRNPAACEIRFALAQVYARRGKVLNAQKECCTIRLLKPDFEGLDDLEKSFSDPVSVQPESVMQKGSESGARIQSGNSSLPLSSASPKRRVSVLIADRIAGKLRLENPLMGTQETLGVTGQVFCGFENAAPSVSLPTGHEEVWLTQRTDFLDTGLVKLARSRGTRIVHDFDDLLWKIPDHNPNAKFPQISLESLAKFLPAVDCVTVSTVPIKESLSQLGIESVVLPNGLLPEDWDNLVPQRRVGRRPRIGWAGQQGVHKADLVLLRAIMDELAEEVEWVFLGDSPEFPKHSGLLFRVFPMVPLEEFPRALANLHLDLAVAPLTQNEFNEGKSDLRILQYGILGYSVIATDIYPHRHAPITCVPNEPALWVKAIRERIHDLESVEAEGEKLRQWVLHNRMIHHYLPQYRAAWLGSSLSTVETASSPVLVTDERSLPEKTEKHSRATFDCSIIIPVYNKCDLTRQCLVSLAEVTKGCTYEVILIDNGSTDGTSSFFETLGGDVRVIRNEENLGFSKGCNQGAAAANGRYLVFLNNDTIVKEGWLSALVREVMEHPDVSIVGSKLLYPNNTVQHCGVAFSRQDCTPYHIFKGVGEHHPAVSIRRELQAVTAACLLIRREIFEAVNGFDEGYQNGFEDVDLCLKVKHQGGKVIYQPESVLYHLEEQTEGRKKNDLMNWQRFKQQWEAKLVVDEDLIASVNDYSIRYGFKQGQMKCQLEIFDNPQEKACWQKPIQIQRILHEYTYQKQTENVPQIIGAEIRGILGDVTHWPDDVEVLRWGAKICDLYHNQDLACEFWEKVVRLQEDQEARINLCKDALSKEKVTDAERHLSVVLTSHPLDKEGLLCKGILMMQRQDFQEASLAFRSCLQVGGDQRKARMGLGMAAMGLNNVLEAWEAFVGTLEQNPDDVEALQWLIRAGTVMSSWDSLISYLTKYLERNPSHCDFRFALAGIHYRCGQVGEAKAHYEKLRNLNPGYEGLDDLAQAFSRSDGSIPTKKTLVA